MTRMAKIIPPDYIDYFSFTLNLKLIIRFSEEFRNSLNDDRKSEDTLMADTSFSGTNVLFLNLFNVKYKVRFK